ncbi:MAG: hypothetical protein HF976_02370 [ANME-2 cluster archaeon]|nr:hypothetical protein [ANME-2 cluster archaeon]MBC2700253.1 hypothetical protein [ANME-2 cluster archaeon]MBC2707878.1 hypothetical protein [ANME-2 cluster archaeon]MBC2745946.1 hypothetical protein [ANME-2 cluster archaeon]
MVSIISVVDNELVPASIHYSSLLLPGIAPPLRRWVPLMIYHNLPPL